MAGGEKWSKGAGVRGLARGISAGLACLASVLGVGSVGGCQTSGRAGPATAPAASASALASPPAEPRLQDALMSICSSGGGAGCDPPTNGEGVYAAKVDGMSGCVSTSGSGMCLRAFINDPSAGVKLKVRSASLSAAKAKTSVYEVPVSASFREEHFPPRYAYSLASIAADEGRLTIKYRRQQGGASEILTASDEQLPSIWLHFHQYAAGGGATHKYTLRFRKAAKRYGPGEGFESEGSLPMYESFYMVHPSAAGGDPGVAVPKNSPAAPLPVWRPLCSGRGRPQDTSFLGGWEVDADKATLTPAGRAVTMSCESGAITRCLQWGYTPWSTEAQAPDAQLLGSCMQAKRAAYFGRLGDFKSYTESGTKIDLWDGLHINDALIEGHLLEAVWAPDGAVCVNKENMRHPEKLPAQLLQSMPSCMGQGLPFFKTPKAIHTGIVDPRGRPSAERERFRRTRLAFDRLASGSVAQPLGLAQARLIVAP